MWYDLAVATGESRLARGLVKSAARAKCFASAGALAGFVFLNARSAGAEPNPVRSASLVVDCRAKSRAISPYIYGVGGEVGELGATARRWGGNVTSRYNWQLGNAWNVGRDWFFENGKSPDYRQHIDDSFAQHVMAALTLPMIGWVAKDTSSVGFPRSVYGEQKASDQYRNGEPGNGEHKDGLPIRPGSPTLTSVEAPPEFIAQWVSAIREADRKRGARGVQLYFLDNEPSLWNSTHRDVHPDPVGYDELLDRTIRYASAVRAVDPDAQIAGPAEWGWSGYFYSAQDQLMGVGMRPDRRRHGDVPLIPWYLKQLADYERAHKTKLLDVLDVHYYPQAPDVFGKAKDANPATGALRIRATRSLWDPSYKDESWIADNVRLIPRLKEWIAQNKPGTKLSIGEYNFGGEQEVSGALAQAEALGRFGVEGVDYAFYWMTPPKDSPAFWAFRAYRNFDGKGGRFLDRSLRTRAVPGVSLFASADESGKHLVLIALNLDPQAPVEAKLELSGCAKPAQVDRFVFSGETRGLVKMNPSAGASPLVSTLPPYSITVLDLSAQP